MQGSFLKASDMTKKPATRKVFFFPMKHAQEFQINLATELWEDTQNYGEEDLIQITNLFEIPFTKSGFDGHKLPHG